MTTAIKAEEDETLPDGASTKEGKMTENDVILQDFIAKLLEDMVPLDPEVSKAVDEYFLFIVR